VNKYQEALEKLRLLDCYDEENFEIKFENLPILQELVEKNERLVAHVKLAIKMLEENNPYAIETLKEVIEQDWSEDE
jgi:hypothetical protein